MRITLTRDAGGHSRGASLDLSPKVAALLIANDAAIEAEQDHEAGNDEASDDPKPKQTRRSQSRKTAATKPAERDDASDADEPAGQKGGGVPPPPPAPPAG